MTKAFIKFPISIKNDNMACVQWCKNGTTHLTHHVLLASGSRLPTIHRPRRKLRCVHVPEIKVIRFAP